MKTLISKYAGAMFFALALPLATLPTAHAEPVQTAQSTSAKDAKPMKSSADPTSTKALPAKTIPASKVTENTDLDTRANVLFQYVTKENGQPKFSEELARQDGASEYLLEEGNGFNQFVAAQTAPEGSKEFGPAYYGNWCGPFHGGGKPIDTLDELCMHHDKCYEEKGYRTCSCDKAFTDGIRRNQGKFSGQTKKYADRAYYYFTKIGSLYCK